MSGSAQIIDGKAVAASVRAEIADSAAAFAAAYGRSPALATILVGDDPASDVYVSNKHKACAEVGITGEDHRLPATTTEYRTDRTDRPAQRARRHRRHPAAAAAARGSRRRPR